MVDATREEPFVSAHELLRPARFPQLASWLGKTMALGYRLTGKDRYDDFRIERVQGLPFIVTPSVFNPRVLRTGEFLVSRIDATLVGRETRVLDMGTGCGVGAVIAARYAHRVVAVDINAAAIRCAHVNALLNHAEHRIELRTGDLFAPVAGERFDLVLFNPPFLRGAPRDDRDRAWRSSDVAERFAAGLPAHLTPGGTALVVLSTFGDAPGFIAQFRRRGFTITVLARRRFVNETLALLSLQLPHPREPA
jgi:release factor glutamine methyltransferase